MSSSWRLLLVPSDHISGMEQDPADLPRADADYVEVGRLPQRVAREWLSCLGACGSEDVSIAGEAVVPGTLLLCEWLDLLEPHVTALGFLDMDLHCEEVTAVTQLLATDAWSPISDSSSSQIDYKPARSPRRSPTYTTAVHCLSALLLVSHSAGHAQPHEGTLQAGELEVLGVFGPLASSTRFFRWVSTPKLATLVLRMHLGFSSCKLPQAAEWARALAPLLRALYLFGFGPEDASLAVLLARLPLLETLVLARVQLSGALIEALSTSGYAHGTRHVGWLCPRLMRVSTSGGRGPKYQLSREAMEAFVSARLAGYLRVASAAGAGPKPQAVAGLVAVRCNGFVLAIFGLITSHERWEWVPATKRHALKTSDWWATSFAEDLDF